MTPDRPAAAEHADAEAVGRLYEKYKSDVYRFARHLAFQAGEAEDLFQETWMRVVRHRDDITPERDMKAWLFTITANLHRDALRRTRLRKLVFFAPRPDAEPEMNPVEAAPAPGPGPDLLAEQSEAGRALDRALAGLPEKQRRVFILKEIEGFKHEEIGGILGIPVNTIKTLLFRAMKRLREELRDYQPGPGARRENGTCDVRTSSVF
jgi:RNA polymerase sigma-70 factor (ECF subfamily)